MRPLPNRVALTILPLRITVEAHGGDTILDAALENGIDIAHECGGNCTCTTCHVCIVEGMENLSPMEGPEAERLETAPDRTPRSRLACQTLLLGGPVTVWVPGDSESFFLPPLDSD